MASWLTAVGSFNMERKRCRELSSPTGITPRQVVKRTYEQKRGEQVKSKKKLSFCEDDSRYPTGPVGKWTAAEDKALVEYVLLTGPESSWPTTINEKYWVSAALFVHQRCCVPKRTCKTIHWICEVLSK